MTWHEDPKWLRSVIGALLVAISVLVGLTVAEPEPESRATPRPATTGSEATEACRRAVVAGRRVSKAAGTALYVAPDVAPLVRSALDAGDDPERIENVLEHLGAIAPSLRRARSYNESGYPPAWWRFQKWSALCLGEPAVSEPYDPPVGNRDDARKVVREFMQARVRGAGAGRFLAPRGRDDFGAGGLTALYPEPPLQDFEIAFVDDLGAGSFEVGVELLFERQRFGETLFVLFRQGRYAIHGGRPGLEGP